MDMPVSPAELDPQRQEQARHYARLRRRLMLLDVALAGLYLIAWLLSGASFRLRDWIYALLPYEALRVAAFGFFFALPYGVMNLPLAYYEGFVLQHRFGLSTQTRRDWVLDQFKGALVSGLLGLLVLEIMYALLRSVGQSWWLWVAVLLLIFNVILANLAPVLLFPLFFKFEPLGEQHADLVERLVQLSKRAGAPVRGVYSFDMSRRTRAANAALVGLGNTRRIILGDTLLNEFTPEEIETILAHELAHHVHHDLPVGIVVQSLITLLGMYLASLGLNWGTATFGFQGLGDVANLPWLGLLLSAYGLLTLPLVNAYSRWRERRADEFALHLTNKGAAFASAFSRLANQNLADANPPRWEEILFYSHPALSKRIAMAQAYTLPNAQGG